jgi:hypothetical protein
MVAGLQPGQLITATATDQFGDTSEFSAAVTVLSRTDRLNRIGAPRCREKQLTRRRVIQSA